MARGPDFLKGYEVADPNCTEAAGTPGRSGSGPMPATASAGAAPPSVNPYVGTAGAAGSDSLPSDNSGQVRHLPGCNYYGDTRIRFNSNGDDGVEHHEVRARA